MSASLQIKIKIIGDRRRKEKESEHIAIKIKPYDYERYKKEKMNKIFRKQEMTTHVSIILTYVSELNFQIKRMANWRVKTISYTMLSC